MRPLRLLGFGFGLAVAGTVMVVRAALDPVAARVVEQAQQDLPPAEPAIAPTAPGPAHDRVRRVRLLLAGAGVVVLVVGLDKLLHAVQPMSYVWLAVWLLGAIVFHDGLVAPGVGALRWLAGRLPLPAASLGWLRGGFVVAGVLVLVVVPAIWAQHLGPANPTVLPGDYLVRLLVVVGVIGVLSVIAALVAGRRAPRVAGR